MQRLVILLALVCVANTARADTAFLMVPRAEERIASAVRAEVLGAVEAALRVEGVTVLNLERARRKGVACEDEACVREALDKLEADFGVHVTLMTVPGGDGADVLGSVGIAFVQRDLVYRASSVRVLDRGIERAVDESVRAARAMQRRGPGPWIVIDGTPADAAVYLNGEQIDDGSLPCEKQVAPGKQYVLEFRRQGFKSEEYRIRVGSDLATAYDVSVKLNSDTVAVPPAPSPSVQASSAQGDPAPARRVAVWQDWALGGAAVAGGALVLVNPLRSLAQHGDCYEGDCTRKVRFGGRSGALLFVGAALVAFGVIVPLGWKPFGHLEVVGDSQTAVLRFSGTFAGKP